MSIYKLILGNNDPYDEVKSPISHSLTIFYIFATLLLNIIMLNLLIAIVGKTNDRVSQMNELIYEKNRVYIIKEYLSNNSNKQKMKAILENNYLVTIYRKEAKKIQENQSESEFIEIKGKMEKLEVSKLSI